MAQASFFCPNCQTMKLFLGEEMNHTAHILASVFLCGLWLPIWILSAATYKPNYRCSFCGHTDEVKYLVNPGQRALDSEAKVVQDARNAERRNAFRLWLRELFGGSTASPLAKIIVLGIAIILSALMIFIGVMIKR